MRIKGTEKRKRLYAIGCLLAMVLMFGTVGGIDHDVISLDQGIWQMMWFFILGLWCCNGIRLEETRTARHQRRW